LSVLAYSSSASALSDSAGTRRAQSEIRDAQAALEAGYASTFVKPFGPDWGSAYWTKWAAISEILCRLSIRPPASVLDVGCGTGWTSVFLAESGYRVSGLDVAPAAITIAGRRAARWDHQVRFEVADMEAFDLKELFDAVLVFDALHHSEQPGLVVANIARHLKPGGWAVFGEPSWLHEFSPHARETTREHGWVERGIRVSALKRACRDAGLTGFRRFFEGTRPYEGRIRDFPWQVARLVMANFWVAPQASIWLAAERQ
jgi:SAM-dependent methyltransferase